VLWMYDHFVFMGLYVCVFKLKFWLSSHPFSVSITVSLVLGILIEI
jgi:hypothetical protein